MRIALGADHAGYAIKEEFKVYLIEQGYEVIDCGTFNLDSCDYPDFAVPVCKSVVNGESRFGVLICGTGIGMSMAANKINGIRCAVCTDVFSATATRAHNDANVLSMGARVVDKELAKEILRAFLTTVFEGGRHNRRVEKIMEQENRD